MVSSFHCSKLNEAVRGPSIKEDTDFLQLLELFSLVSLAVEVEQKQMTVIKTCTFILFEYRDTSLSYPAYSISFSVDLLFRFLGTDDI